MKLNIWRSRILIGLTYFEKKAAHKAQFVEGVAANKLADPTLQPVQNFEGFENSLLHYITWWDLQTEDVLCAHVCTLCNFENYYCGAPVPDFYLKQL